eukprot:GDKI01048857.1.p1 GENE.GDKI01048857.1~~GDKI01048857.1.p1  ORF type:complete len:225 (+),score=65.56 GDKI01048857.1:1-675(+)
MGSIVNTKVAKMAKSIRSKVKRKFRTAKRVEIKATVELNRIEKAHEKVIKLQQGESVAEKIKVNKFLHPDHPDAEIPQKGPTKNVDFRSEALPDSQTAFIGGQRSAGKFCLGHGGRDGFDLKNHEDGLKGGDGTIDACSFGNGMVQPDQKEEEEVMTFTADSFGDELMDGSDIPMVTFNADGTPSIAMPKKGTKGIEKGATLKREMVKPKLQDKLKVKGQKRAK